MTTHWSAAPDATCGLGQDTFLYDHLKDSYRNYSNGANVGDLILGFDVTQDVIDVSALGFVGLGDGRDGTLDLVLNDSATRTYLKSREADASGNRFEIALAGDFSHSFGAANLHAAQVSADPLELLGVPPPDDALLS